MRLLTLGAIGAAAIYGVVKGMKNGTFKQLVQNIPNQLNVQNLQQLAKPLQQMTQPLQGMTTNALTKNLPKQQG